jgi:hypothetical protein
MPIAEYPLHGSGGAALPHPALALGEKREALARVWMTDVRDREPTRNQAPHLRPRFDRRRKNAVV